MKKISKRDILFIILGIFIYILFESLINWDSTKAAFNKGYNQAKQEDSQPRK